MNDPNIIEYTKGYTAGEVDCSIYGIETAEGILFAMQSIAHVSDQSGKDYVTGYSTAINVHKERDAS